MKTYRDLDVYKKAYELSLRIHNIAGKLISLKEFDLADQLKRASRSIPSNIAEGYGRGISEKDTANLLRMSLGSTNEVLFNLEFLKDTEMIDKDDVINYIDQYTIVVKQLTKLVQSLEVSRPSALNHKPNTSN
jgi:four helix bundle protein